MSVSQYLWAVARSLQSKVYPGAEAGVPRAALQHSINIISILANALEGSADVAVQRPACADIPNERAATDRLPGPAENAAAYGDTAAALASAAQRLDSAVREPGSVSGRRLRDAGMRAMITWEKLLLDAAMARMDEVLRATATPRDDPALQIDQRALQSLLRKRTALADLEIREFRQVLGGRSRQTGLFRVVGGQALDAQWVIQRSIPGYTPGPAFASVAGQFETLKRLHAAGMKVPRPLYFESGSEELSSPFLVSERISGSTVEPDYWRVPESPTIALQLAEEMALLHSQPVDELRTVVAKSRDRSDRQGWIDELNRLTDDWNSLTHWPSVTVSAAICWLRANVDCIADRQTLVHNDMVFHNVLGDGDRLTAILDWEQISIGHPAEDLGYCFPAVSGVVDWNQFIDRYQSAGGPPVSLREIDYFALRAILRLMTLVLKGGRDVFEKGLSDDVLVASAGAFFSQRLMHRFASVLEAVLDRN